MPNPRSAQRWAALITALLMAFAPVGLRAEGGAGGARAEREALRYRMLSIADGLPHVSVYGVARDPFGFLWLGTLEGLARYDGQRFVVYRPDPANPNTPASAQIDTLYSDSAGTLWIGTFASGLDSFDPRAERFTHYRHDPADASSLSNDAIRAIYEDDAGALWVGTLNGGLNRLDRASGLVTRYRHNPADPQSLSHDHVRDLAPDGAGGLWVATESGLDRLDPATGRFSHLHLGPAGVASPNVNGVAALLHTDGALWVGLDGAGLARYDEAEQRLTVFRSDPSDPASLSNNHVVALAKARPGELWVGTYGGGLNRLDIASGHFTAYGQATLATSGLPTDNIETIVPTPDGLLWVGTEDRGVAVVDLEPGPFTVYRVNPNAQAQPDALWPGVVRAAVEDRDGALWLGVADAGLARFDRARGVVTHYRHDPADPDSPAGNRPQALLLDRRGELWIGYHSGLDRLDRATGGFIHYPADPADPQALSQTDVFDLHESRDGAIWIATRGGGLNRLDPATGRFTRYRHDPNNPSSISSDNVGAVSEDQQGHIWAGTESQGLSRLDLATGRFTNYRHDPGDAATPGSNTVLALYAAPDGRIWAAGWNSGLDYFDPTSGRFTRYTVADGLLSAKINGIQPDTAGNLWLTSNQGLMRFDPRTGTTVNYTSDSAGLPPGGFALNGSAEGDGGELILGGFDSLMTFFPSQIRPQTEVAPVVITNVLLANQPVVIGPTSPLTTTINGPGALTLSYRDRVVSFEFTALDYRWPQAAHYRYRLAGFDPDWVEVNSQQRIATYTNLDPGRYMFEVQAANGEGVWGAETRRVPITVIPPWWQTWWFTLLAGLGVVATITGGVGIRLRSLHDQQRRLEAEVVARTADLAASNASLSRQMWLEHTLIMSLDLDTLLGEILEQIRQVVDFTTGAIFTADGETLTLHAMRSQDLTPTAGPVRLSLSRLPLLSAAMDTGTTQVFNSSERDSETLAYLSEAFGQQVAVHTWLAAPLVVQDYVIGVLVLAHPERGRYSADECRQVEPFISPVALALENERLRQRARHAAVLEERTRMARELHDAVTQTLFSASLIARGLPAAIERDPARAAQGAADLWRLTGGALAEMRALLLELRPKALTETSLGALLQLLSTSLQSRTTAPITLEIDRDCTLAPAVQLACYRIAQEALNNVVKHADAGEVAISVDCTPEMVLLQVTDDGRGFTPEAVRPDALGLGIMRERATEIGARLKIISEPGEGTSITLQWHAAENEAPRAAESPGATMALRS